MFLVFITVLYLCCHKSKCAFSPSYVINTIFSISKLHYDDNNDYSYDIKSIYSYKIKFQRGRCGRV